MSKACTFFGHRDCPPTIKPALKAAIEELVHNHGVDMFYVGNNGQFDAYCRSVLKSLGVNYAVVLYRMPGKPSEYEDFSDSMLPEGIVETGPARFALERRNRWMVNQSQYLICFLKQRMYGGTAKFVALAERKGLTVINLFQEKAD